MELSKRQKKLLEYIIKEFIESAEAVGSLTLHDKYELDVSPATLRLEMSKLSDEGYLYKEHSSAGRTPTTLGLRYFLNEMLEEEEIDTVRETRLKEQLYSERFTKHQFIRQATQKLSQLTEGLAIALLDNVVHTCGLAYLVRAPEFEESENLEKILSVLESTEMLSALFQKNKKDDAVRILVGDELGIETIDYCGLVFAPFKFYRGRNGFIGVFGSCRLNYGKVVPAVRLISEFIEDSIRGWA